jgi:hypothetical protein
VRVADIFADAREDGRLFGGEDLVQRHQYIANRHVPINLLDPPCIRRDFSGHSAFVRIAAATAGNEPRHGAQSFNATVSHDAASILTGCLRIHDHIALAAPSMRRRRAKKPALAEFPHWLHAL